MSLEINKNDSSIDTRQIPNNDRAFTRYLAGFLTTVFLFSGSIMGPTIVHATEYEQPKNTQSSTYVSPSTVIEIPEIYQYEVYDVLGKEIGEEVTVADLNSINDIFMTIAVRDDSSLEWLNHVGNIEYLTLIIHDEDSTALKDVKTLRGAKHVSILSPLLTHIELKKDDYKFLRNSGCIESLSMGGNLIFEPGFIESLTSIKKLSLMLQEGNHTFDCSKLGFLDELELTDPYTAAVYITQEDYDALLKKGVKVTFTEPEDLAKFKEINKRLDDIVDSLSVDENSSDQEKLDAILCYVLDNLTYDPEVSAALRNNEPHDSLTRSFYYDGQLYGALEKDTAICGNYAALTNALAERLKLDTYYLVSTNHAWSLVEVEGKQYYVDSTWLDSDSLYREETTEEYDEYGRLVSSTTMFVPVPAADAIRDGRGKELDWYMENPNSYPKSNGQAESHIVINLPSFFNLNPQEEQDEIENKETTPEETTHETTTPTEETTKPIVLDGQDVELRFGKKAWIISGAAAIGILTAIGGAVAVHKKKERERKRRMQRQNTDYFGSTYGSAYDSSFDDFFPDSSSHHNNSRRR